MSRPARKPSAKKIPWTQAPLAPVVLLSGGEGLLADRAVQLISDLAHEADANVEVTQLEAAGYERGMLEMLASPSLFGEQKLVIVSGVEQTNDEFLTDATEYVASPTPNEWLVHHIDGGGLGMLRLDVMT